MSSPPQTWQSEFQARFGTIPPAAQGERLVQLCKELIAEREQLRDALARTQAERDQYLKSLYHYLRKEHEKLDFDEARLFAEAVSEPPLDQLIAELDGREGK